MAAIVLCLLCLVAAALWLICTTMCTIRAFVTASMEVLVYLVAALMGYAALYLGFQFLIIVFTDISVLWDIIVSLFSNIGGLIAVIVIVGILIAVGSFLMPALVVGGTVLLYVASAVMAVVLVVFEFIETKSQAGYNAVVSKIANRIDGNEGEKR